MQIKVIAVGKLKEKYWVQAVNEYTKRLNPFARIDILEVSEERLPDNPSAAEVKQALVKEGERIEKLLASCPMIIPLAIEGQSLSSEELARMIEKMTVEGRSQLTFIIGGSHGLAQEVIKKGDFLLSFSPMTFPHQMMRVILLEQLYRAFSIIKGTKYHK